MEKNGNEFFFMKDIYEIIFRSFKNSNEKQYRKLELFPLAIRLEIFR